MLRAVTENVLLEIQKTFDFFRATAASDQVYRIMLKATAHFELVRIIAKQEAPLRALQANGVLITTIAEVSFYGRDQAGNEVTAVGSIGVTFGNFGDPE